MMPEPSNIRVRIVGATDVGLVREHNEDSYLIIDLDNGETDFSHLREYDLGNRGALLVVCDGMGGAAAGEVASQMAVQSMRQQLLPEPPASQPPTAGESGSAKDSPAAAEPAASPEPSSPEAKSTGGGQGEGEMHKVARRLREAAQRANQEIYEAACADIAKAGMGTTLTALMLLRSHVVVAQVGDSRAYLLRHGKLTQITHDQSLVNQLLDSGQITPEQAKLFEHSNVILQALGVQEDIEVVLSSETLRRDDRLLLCSDGLVGVVSDEEIQEVLNSTENLEDGVHRLIDMARAGGGPDNITVILAQSYGEGLPAAGPEELAQYRAMALDGDKPQERRTWSADYGYAGSAGAGRDLGPSSASSGRMVSPVSLLSLAAVLALAVTGLVVGLVLYPQRPGAVTCRVVSDQAGLWIMVDDKQTTIAALPSVELKLSPGEHRLWLSSGPDNIRRSAELLQTVSAGQPACEIQLHTQPAATGPSLAPDGPAADAGTSPAADAGHDGGGAGVDAAAAEGSDDGSGQSGSGAEGDQGGPGHAKRHHRHHPKAGEPGGQVGTGQSGGTDTTTPAATPDLASPSTAPTPVPAKTEPKPLEPAQPEKSDKPTPPEKSDKPAPADKPPADKPPADKPPADKPPADKPAQGADKPIAPPPAPPTP
jgi:serine/threonine protein phosphatase PrpC